MAESSRTSAIPSPQRVADTESRRVLSALKETVESLKGRRPNQRPIDRLPDGATTQAIIDTINEIVDRINA